MSNYVADGCLIKRFVQTKGHLIKYIQVLTVNGKLR